MKVVGLTGGIGAGKSAAAQILGSLGAVVINADRVGHESYLPGTPGWDQVVAEFGRGVVSAEGTIDRKRLGAIVFADPARLARLNNIVHPIIAAVISAQIAAARTASYRQPIVVEAALLIEARWDCLVDEVWMVTAPLQVIRQRLATAQSLAPEAIAERMRAQLSDADRSMHADVVIDNDGSLTELRARLVALWHERGLAP